MSDENVVVKSNVRPKTLSRQVFKLCASILIPGMIGLLTIAIAVVQLQIARQQREQDLAIAETNQHNSLLIANHTREQDLLIANTLRWDAVFASYVNDMSATVSTANFSFDSIDPLLSSVIRAKTLTTCRQLDAVRKTYLIQFLFELGALTATHNPIDLTGAELDNIDLSVSVLSSRQVRSLRGVSLISVSLKNASFVARGLQGANFTESNLQGADFRFAHLNNVAFHKCDLRNATFENAVLYEVDFSSSDLRDAVISDEQLASASSVLGAVLPNGTMGSNLNLIVDGNAERASECREGEMNPMEQGVWTVIPPDSVGTTHINRSFAKQFGSHLIHVLAQSGADEGRLESISHRLWNVQRCSFATLSQHRHAQLTQSIIVPEHYRHSAANQSYSWYFSIFCGTVRTSTNISVVLQESDRHNRTLKTHVTMLHNHGASIRHVPCHKEISHATFTLRFDNVALDGNESVVFCDNLHLSLELSSNIATAWMI